MPHIIELQPAYLLHSRPYRDSSLLLDFLTPEFGRVSAISRGIRSGKNRNKALIQVFTPVQISFSGKGELKTLRQIEPRGFYTSLSGNKLFSAMYVNEIVVRLFNSHESDPAFFAFYSETILRLGQCESNNEIEPVLRIFEMGLLEALGYGIDFYTEARSHDAIEDSAQYYLQEDTGFIKMYNAAENKATGSEKLFYGEDLLKIGDRDFSAEKTRRAAKHILRQLLGYYLGDRPITSRTLYSRN